jgi:hypothetical protein
VKKVLPDPALSPTAGMPFASRNAFPRGVFLDPNKL